MPDFGDLANKLERARAEMDAVRQLIGRQVVEGSAGDGIVSVKMSGDYRLLEVNFGPAAADQGGLAALGPLIVEAVNDAMREAAKLAELKLSDLAGELGIETPSPAPDA
ncbi:MAG: YbaB/EbfC family nucleoid-associated protein [Actinobacteria bacterium]|nr:YbaB/EbfC family nucleoid-associated protein [Actinomycetota bacterium]